MRLWSDVLDGLCWIQALETSSEAEGWDSSLSAVQAAAWSPRLPVQLCWCLRSTPCKYFSKAYIQMLFIRPD